jgi:hypothetical protein
VSELENTTVATSGAERGTVSSEREAAILEEHRQAVQVRVDGVDWFLEASWQAAEALLQGGERLSLFAIQRAYYALYNACVATADILDISLDRYQQGSHHHEDTGSIPHGQLPLLIVDLLKVIYFDEAASGDTSRAEQAFETARMLQKYRKRADYMGCERVSTQGARECIGWARTLTETIWGYTKEHYDDDWR